jgi:hypothetical protein
MSPTMSGRARRRGGKTGSGLIEDNEIFRDAFAWSHDPAAWGGRRGASKVVSIGGQTPRLESLAHAAAGRGVKAMITSCRYGLGPSPRA